jgi:hypothetical protein
MTIKAQSAVIDHPTNCMHSLPKSCVFRFLNHQMILQEGAEIHAFPGTTLLYRKGFGYSLLDGKALLLAKKPWSLYHFGYFFKIEGEVFIELDMENKLKVTNLNANVFVQSQKHSETLVPGFKNWYAISNGIPIHGYFRALEAGSVLSLLNKIWHVPADFKKQHWAQYRHLWKNRVEVSSSFYRDVAHQIEHKNNQKRSWEEQKLSKAKQVDDSLRKLFRKKNFLD